MLLVIRVVIVISVASDVPDVANSASDRYQQIARSDGLPYRDVDVEYAPGELLIALLVGSSSGASAVAGLAVIAFVSDVTAWLAIRKDGDERPRCDICGSGSRSLRSSTDVPTCSPLR